MANASALLTTLNDDIYTLIFEELSKQDSLAFSMTCHLLRKALMPAIFGRLVSSVPGPEFWMEPEHRFVPTSLRPYVHSLVLRDSCPDQVQHYFEDLYFTTDPKRCGAFPSVALAARLRELPHLRSLTLRRNRLDIHGITWDTLVAILSVPHLREVKLIGVYICPYVPSPLEGDIPANAPPLAPITTFHYQIRDTPRAAGYEMETAALATALTELHEGLETLTLPSESAPLSTLAQIRWPRLRKVTFYGTSWVASTPIITALLSQIPCLQDLSFKLYTTTSQTQVPRIYDDLHVSPPLVRLVLSAPNPEDSIFDCLPMTLRELSLRYYPHVHEQQYFHDIQFVYDSPRYDLLLYSQDILSILGRCSDLDLEKLEVEYRADESDDTLLRYMAVTFPNVTSLKIHRYRSAMEEQERRDVSIRNVAELLVPMSRLRRLKIYMDSVEMPQPILTSSPWSGFLYKYDDSQIERYREVVLNTAAISAELLSNTLRVLLIRGADFKGPKWCVFDVSAGAVVCSKM